MTTPAPEIHAAWIRLAQAVSAVDQETPPVECETTVRVSQAVLRLSAQEIEDAKAATRSISVQQAAEVLSACDRRMRERIFHGLVNVAFADGEYRRAENRILAAIASRFDLNESDMIATFRAARVYVALDKMTFNESVID